MDCKVRTGPRPAAPDDVVPDALDANAKSTQFFFIEGSHGTCFTGEKPDTSLNKRHHTQSSLVLQIKNSDPIDGESPPNLVSTNGSDCSPREGTSIFVFDDIRSLL